MNIISTGVVATLLLCQVAAAQTISPDNTAAATAALQKARTEQHKLLKANNGKDPALLEKMLDLGMWSSVDSVLSKRTPGTINDWLLRADLLLLNNDFFGAQQLVDQALKQSPKNEKAIRLKAVLEMQAWKLEEAANRCRSYLASASSEKMTLLLGKVYLLQKKYDAALTLADELIKKNASNAAAYQLKADVFFWNQQPSMAEAPLLTSLQLDPFNADARFSYGYAIWRRVDARQLNAMAAQWELALAINPLHFQTHWHWGNGHTNLTYADYAEANDDLVRQELKQADELFKAGKFAEAIQYTRQVEDSFPGSVIPLLHRGSLYYSNFDDKNLVRLDSAEQLFRRILGRKKHYGPAHNGLSAVIKSKRIPYLASYDSVTQQLLNPGITDKTSFERVFPDVVYFPGTIGKGMVWNQLFTAVVYFPFLSTQNRSFHVPPLHVDLATAMNSTTFRYNTTFDNRQWMDIRGVGSGAAAIEYVERGAYGERNVVLHEYVHLFHGSVLTDFENRAIRALYYKAMKEGRTLDYYSQNNESEYFAQTYPAYFEPVKVHPLDFKSMNTTYDLKTKDPEMYQFLDQLVKKERAYLDGDKKAMASNWSQVYLNMSTRQRNNTPELSARYIDTALSYDPNYIPAMLAYAQLKSSQKQFADADAWLKKAEQLSPNYAPVYVAKANLAAARVTAGDLAQEQGFKDQQALLNKAKSLETDYSEQARINGLQRELYRNYAQYGAGITVAEEYIKNGAEVSTYLRDRKDDARSYAAWHRVAAGDRWAIDELRNLVLKKPQNFELRKLYATALLKQQQYATALETLQEAQRILAASKNQRADYDVIMAEALLGLKKPDSARALLKNKEEGIQRFTDADKLRLVRMLKYTGQHQEAEAVMSKLPTTGLPEYTTDYKQTMALLKG